MGYGLPFFIEPEERGVKRALDKGYSSLFGTERPKNITGENNALGAISFCVNHFNRPPKESYRGNPLHGNCEICIMDPINNPRCCGYKRFTLYTFFVEESDIDMLELQDDPSRLEEAAVA